MENAIVQFSAVAPRRLVKGDAAIINILMYEDTFRYVVDELIHEAESPVKETKSGRLKVSQGAAIRMILTSPDIDITDSEQTQTWQGEYLNFYFAVTLSEQYEKQQVLFHAHVYVNDVIATKLSFTAQCVSSGTQNIAVSRSDILSAFVSYASQDRGRVAAIVQGMKRARPDLDIFFDVEKLRPGEDWERTLYRAIEERDMLFLCWSQFARQSKWVEIEWRYALDHKGIDYIEPIPIDPPEVCPPPEELKKKHFGDKLLYYQYKK